MIHFVPGSPGVRLRRRVGQVHAAGYGRTQVRRIVRLGRPNVRQRGVLQYGMRVVLTMLWNGTVSLRKEKKMRNKNN